MTPQPTVTASPEQLSKILPQARAMLWCLKTGDPIDHDVSARADLEELGLIAVHFPRENWKITLTEAGQAQAADIETIILNLVKLDDLEALRALHYKTAKTIDDGAAYALNQAGLLDSIDGFKSYALTDLGKAIIALSEINLLEILDEDEDETPFWQQGLDLRAALLSAKAANNKDDAIAILEKLAEHLQESVDESGKIISGLWEQALEDAHVADIRLKPHHVTCLQAAAEQHGSAQSSGQPGKAWMHPKLLQGSRVADECTERGLLERSRKPLHSSEDAQDRIFTYRITDAGLAAVASQKVKTMTPGELEDALTSEKARTATLQESLIAAAADADQYRAQATDLAAQLLTPQPTDPLADMDADGLRAIVAQLKQQMSATAADLASVRAKLTETEALCKSCAADKFRFSQDLQREQVRTTNLAGQLESSRHHADALQTSLTKAEAAAAPLRLENITLKQRAQIAEQRVAELTAPRPDGHIIARAITEAELDALADQGRKVSHFQFMPDGTLNAVVEPLRHQPQPRPQRNQPAYTPVTGFPIPTTPSRSPVPSQNKPAAPTPTNSVTAVMVIPPTVTPPARVPSFPEILSARTSGQITADQFTRYANALAGHNAAQRMTGMTQP